MAGWLLLMSGRCVDSWTHIHSPVAVSCQSLLCTVLYYPLLCCVSSFTTNYRHYHHHPLLQYSTPRITSPRLRMHRGSQTI
jgi:hypothetical protein